jgi:hypothetical protein
MHFVINFIKAKPEIDKEYNLVYQPGQILIGQHRERFWSALDSWSVKDYAKQWIDGLKRIKSHDISCLIINYIGIPEDPSLLVWAIFREGNRLFFENRALFNWKDKQIFKKPFVSKNCYEYIEPRSIYTNPASKCDVYSTKYIAEEVDALIESLQRVPL